MQQFAPVVHLLDDKRPQGSYKARGAQYQQWPVVCAADIVEVKVSTRSAHVWTQRYCEVTCAACKEVIEQTR